MTIRKAKKQPEAAPQLRCDKCYYYDNDGDSDAATGYCRRYPTASPGGDWPTVCNDDWCGEHRLSNREEHLSIAEAGARYFGLSVNGSYLAAKRGDLPWVWIGTRKRVPIAAMSQLSPKE